MDEQQYNSDIIFRVEFDSVGEKEVPSHAYYGVHTARARENFPITGLFTHKDMINSLAQIKKAAAIANQRNGLLDSDKASAIQKACDEIISGEFYNQFLVDPIQGGAGTSLNMNANEVIANRAIEILGGDKGNYNIVNPNDDVNMGQSTNDVIPTAGKMTVLKLIEKAQTVLKDLHQALLEKSEEFDMVIKMGRTQLQDAVPIRLGQEFGAYACMVERDINRLERIKEEMKTVNLGATAIGTGINADFGYINSVVDILNEVSGLGLSQAENLVDATQNIDAFSAVSGTVKVCALSLSKMSNDLRLLSSGPFCGIGEINLPPRQNGSSIMPGKINPVIPEVVNQVAFRIAGNDTTITMAVEAGQFELNAFEPVVFYSLFQSLDILREAVKTLTENCIKGITANAEHCKEMVERSVGTVTALTPYIGYVKAAIVADTAIKKGRTIREVILEEGLLSEEQLDKILDPVAMTTPASINKDIIR